MHSRDPAEILDQRKGGRRLVFSTIRARERVARIDIAQETSISPATVTSITAELIAAGLIEETHRDPKSQLLKRGRPRVNLQIRGNSHIIAGIKFSNSKASVAILDFVGEPIGDYEKRFTVPEFQTSEFVEFVGHLLEEAAEACGIAASDISGVGIGLTGIVDGSRGFVHWSPQLVSRNVDLKKSLETDLNLPVFLDNDANLVAMAEQWFGLGRNVSDFIVVTIEYGVGMGIVIDNKIYRGARGCGAEFGHTKIAFDGALCRCGQRGCLEAYLSDYGILREANIDYKLTDKETSQQKLEALFLKSQGGDKQAVEIFDRAGKMFAMGLANIVNTFDPKLIILSGKRMQFDKIYADFVLPHMKEMVVHVDAAAPEIRIHAWGELMWARGAAAYAMEGVTEIALRRIADSAA